MSEFVGLDVSKHQGNIDWSKAAVGQDFVIIRAGYGRFADQEDPCFKKNVEGAYAAGLDVGVYWYSYAGTEAEARQEAEVCLSVIEPYRDKITLPVFFDQEYEPSIIAASKAVRTACCVAFCKAVKDAEYTAGMYGSQDWLQNKITLSSLPEDTVIWCARYSGNKPVIDYDIWQYSSTGRVSGISGNVDLNRGTFPISADGWQKISGKWYWYEDKKPVKSVWRKISGKNGTYWYYFDSNGVMLKGMQKVDKKIYYFNEKAALGIPEGAMILTSSAGDVQTTA